MLIQELFELVIKLAREKNETRILAILNEGYSINFRWRLLSPIAALAAENDSDSVEFLINRFHADITEAAKGYATAGNVAAVNTLLDQGASKNYVVENYAAAGNDVQANILLKDAMIYYAARGYAYGGYVRQAEECLTKGANLNHLIEGYGFSGNLTEIEKVLAKGGSFNFALGSTAMAGHDELLKRLVASNPNNYDEYLIAALTSASKGGYVEPWLLHSFLTKILPSYDPEDIQALSTATFNIIAQGFAFSGHICEIERLLAFGQANIGFIQGLKIAQIKTILEVLNRPASKEVLPNVAKYQPLLQHQFNKLQSQSKPLPLVVYSISSTNSGSATAISQRADRNHPENVGSLKTRLRKKQKERPTLAKKELKKLPETEEAQKKREATCTELIADAEKPISQKTIQQQIRKMKRYREALALCMEEETEAREEILEKELNTREIFKTNIKTGKKMLIYQIYEIKLRQRLIFIESRQFIELIEKVFRKWNKILEKELRHTQLQFTSNLLLDQAKKENLVVKIKKESKKVKKENYQLKEKVSQSVSLSVIQLHHIKWLTEQMEIQKGKCYNMVHTVMQQQQANLQLYQQHIAQLNFALQSQQQNIYELQGTVMQQQTELAYATQTLQSLQQPLVYDAPMYYQEQNQLPQEPLVYDAPIHYQEQSQLPQESLSSGRQRRSYSADPIMTRKFI